MTKQSIFFWYSFDFAIEDAPSSLQHELIDLQASTKLKHLFQKMNKLRFNTEYVDERKFPKLKQMAMRIIAATAQFTHANIFFLFQRL